MKYLDFIFRRGTFVNEQKGAIDTLLPTVRPSSLFNEDFKPNQCIYLHLSRLIAINESPDLNCNSGRIRTYNLFLRLELFYPIELSEHMD